MTSDRLRRLDRPPGWPPPTLAIGDPNGEGRRGDEDGAVAGYAGFWRRVLAGLLDSLIIGTIQGVAVLPLALTGVVDPRTQETGLVVDLLLLLVPVAYVLGYWVDGQATPGKIAVRARIVDARTGGRPGAGRFALRYAGYLVSALPLGLGFLWAAFDQRKQAWHDKLARTVVVHTPEDEPAGPEAGPRTTG